MSGTMVVIMILGAVISAAIAVGKNRNVIGWLVAGALLPLISIVAVACLPPLPTLPEPPPR